MDEDKKRNISITQNAHPKFNKLHLRRGVCNTLLQMTQNQKTKTTSDAGKTMSYVEKIMSDIIQTTSDLFRRLQIFEKQVFITDVFARLQPWQSVSYANRNIVEVSYAKTTPHGYDIWDAGKTRLLCFLSRAEVKD